MSRNRWRWLLGWAFSAAMVACAPPPHRAVYGVRAAPPAEVVETVPPAPGPEYVWIPGHYRWDEGARGYIWVAGHWVVPPQGYRAWVPGHWVERDGGWVWVEGHWS